MKEIDLLPEWYKSSRRRQIGYWAQYIFLGVVLAVIIVWSMVELAAISKTKKEIASLEPAVLESRQVSEEFRGLESEIERLEKKANIIRKIDSRIDVARVLAELSFLVDEKVVLSRVSFSSEKIPDVKGKRAGSSGAKSAKDKFVGNVRFKIVLNGVATGAGNVAELTRGLEQSPYFSGVIPLYSRNKNIKAAAKLADKHYQVSEFEISCYLANYKYEPVGFAKNVE